MASLLQTLDGNLYGTSKDGTSPDVGNIFKFQLISGQVSGGLSHTLAVANSGNVWTWGQNTYGQLGLGTTNSYTYPVNTLLTNMVSVTAGYYHSASVKNDGTVYAWGRNNYGQTSDGGTTNCLSPVHVSTLDPVTNSGVVTQVVAVAGGSNHTLALKSDGTVWAWGNNGNGQLGNHSLTTKYSTPVQVLTSPTAPLTNIVAVSAGANDSMALSSGGTVYTWGDSTLGQLGRSTTSTTNTVAVVIPSFTNVAAIASGASHNLALKNDGTVWAWGDNYFGEIGNGSTNTTGVASPAQVTGPLTNVAVTAISAGGYATNGAPNGSFSTALAITGTNYVWGSDSSGQLADGFNSTNRNRSTPQDISGLDPAGQAYVNSLVSGAYFGLAVKTDGSVVGWGQNNNGQLGNGSTAAAQDSVVTTTNFNMFSN